MPAKIEFPNGDDIVKAYLGGISIKQTAQQFGVSRPVITRFLKERGVKIRPMRESMLLAWSQIDPNERRRIAGYANAGRRSKPVSEKELCHRAITRQKSLTEIGSGEMALGDMLKARGFNPVYQLAVGRYNIDIAIHPVAVEVTVGAWNRNYSPLVPHRIKYLVDRGWFVLYVQINKRHFLSAAAADEVISYLKAAKRNPAMIGQYRMIWGTGEPIALPRDYLNHLPPIPPKRPRKYRGRYTDRG